MLEESKKEEVIKILKKADNLQKGKEVSLAKEFIALDDKIDEVEDGIENIISVLSKIDNKEIKTYESELSSLLESIKEIKQSVDNKDMIVNIPLDNLSKNILKVETAIKNIKEIKIPEYPTDISINNLNNSDIVEAIQNIPQFPIKEFNTFVSSLENKLNEIRLDIPEFDYLRVENKLQDIVQAIKKIKISVSSGGSGSPEIVKAVENLPNALNEETVWLLRRMVKLMESNATVDSQNRQRISVENQVSILPSSYYSPAGQWNFASNVIPITNSGSVVYVQPVQTGPVDPRWGVIDQARLVYNQGIRSHLSFT